MGAVFFSDGRFSYSDNSTDSSIAKDLRNVLLARVGIFS